MARKWRFMLLCPPGPKLFISASNPAADDNDPRPLQIVIEKDPIPNKKDSEKSSSEPIFTRNFAKIFYDYRHFSY